MKISKTRIKEIVMEELKYHIVELLEAEDEEDKDQEEPEKDPKSKVDVAAANDDNAGKPPSASKIDVAPKKGAKAEPSAPEGDFEEPSAEGPPEEEVPTPEEPADDELSQDVEDPEDEDPEGGDISSDVAGKSVQSVTMQDSEMMKGAKEIVIQFNEQPHPLRILIGKSGVIKFHYKGAVHNEL